MDGRIRASVLRNGVESPDTSLDPQSTIARSAFPYGEHSYVGPIQYDERFREPLLDIAVPIIDRRSGKAAAVLFARVRFKRIWDLLPEMRCCSRSLRSLGKRYATVTRSLARIGADEFAVLMEHCQLDQALRVAEVLRRIAESLRFAWNEQTFTIGVRIGVVAISRHSESVNALLGAADNACYVAKDAGRNRVHVYREDDVDLAKRRDVMRWVGILTQALEEGRFELYAQQIVEIGGRDGTRIAPRIEHFELLLRLVDANGERILPGAFLPEPLITRSSLPGGRSEEG